MTRVITEQAPRCNHCGEEIKGERYSVYDHDEKDTYDLDEKCLEKIVRERVKKALSGEGYIGRGRYRVSVNYCAVSFGIVQIKNSEKSMISFNSEVAFDRECYLFETDQEVFDLVFEKIKEQMTV